MNEAKRAEIQKWLIKSQHDLGSARRLMEGDDPYLDTAVYYCGSSGIRRVQLYYPHPQPSNDARKVCDPHKRANLRCF